MKQRAGSDVRFFYFAMETYRRGTAACEAEMKRL